MSTLSKCFLKLTLCLFLASSESTAAEETVFGGQGEGDHSPESGQAVVGSSPQGRVGHPAGRAEIPPHEAPEEGSARHCKSSGTTVSGRVGTYDFENLKRQFTFVRERLITTVRCPYGYPNSFSFS